MNPILRNDDGSWTFREEGGEPRDEVYTTEARAREAYRLYCDSLGNTHDDWGNDWGDQ